MKVGEGEGGMLELSRMGMGLLDEIVSLGALARRKSCMYPVEAWIAPSTVSALARKETLLF